MLLLDTVEREQTGCKIKNDCKTFLIKSSSFLFLALSPYGIKRAIFFGNDAYRMSCVFVSVCV